MKSIIAESLSFKHCYLIGIKGVGMTALAQCLLDKGIHVSGCDVNEDFVTEKILSSLNLTIDGLEVATLPATIDCVIYGSAHEGIHHRLVQEAMRRKLQTYSHAQILGLLSQEKQTIAICGVGGKSTTSALIAWTLEKLGANPSYQVGVGEIIGLPRTGRWDNNGSLFVVEADEYAENPQAVAKGEVVIPRFHYLRPTMIVCTNLLYDHPDVYTSFEDTIKTFQTFFLQIKVGGTLIWNADDHNLRQLIGKVKTIRPDILTLSFGISEVADLKIEDLGYQNHIHRTKLVARTTSVELQSSSIINFALPGLHNLQNAAAAWLVMCSLQYSASKFAQFFSNFKSTARRFQLLNQRNSIYYYDDYAHHPTEILATLTACKDQFPHARLIAIFQPHTFSRTEALLEEFVTAFTPADILIVTPIFGSARESGGTITATEFASVILRNPTNTTEVLVAESLSHATQLISTLELSDAVVITLGAGDVYTIHEHI